MKVYESLKASLKATSGVTYLGFVKDRNMFLLKVDRSLQPHDDFMNTILRPYGWSYYIKEGTSINKVILTFKNVIDKEDGGNSLKSN
ncbi:MAG: hypothetical protein ACHQRM_02400 [Bacteroidia bacterium]